jgi:hypothetical protein
MNNAEIKIRRVDEGRTNLDPDFHYADGSIGLTDDITLTGQICYNRDRERSPEFSGDAPKSDGHVLIRRSVLTAAGISSPDTDLKGGVITSLAGNKKWFKIIEIRDSAHMSGTSNLVRIAFKDDQKREGSA